MTTATRGKLGAMGPAIGRKHAPTAGQIRRAKQQAVGGRRKRCTRGKNCSAACISGDKLCLVTFPEPVQDPIRRVRDYLMQKNNITPGSIQDKRINAAIDKIVPVIKVATEGKHAVPTTSKVTKPEVEWKRDAKRAERPALPWKEIQGLKERKDLLSQAEVEREAMKALHREATSRGLRLPRAELEMIYEVLPKNVQTSLAKSGRAGTDQWYAGRDDQGKATFSRGAGKERAIAVLDMWFRPGGTDAYQGRGSKMWAPPDLSVEHIIPLSKGGIDAPSDIAANGHFDSRPW